MTIVISCNLPDGFILGVDDGSTALSPEGSIINVSNTQNIFKLWNKPIGVATYGLGFLDSTETMENGDKRTTRGSIESYIRRFEQEQSEPQKGKSDIDSSIFTLKFDLMREYMFMMRELGKSNNDAPAFGLVIGGFFDKRVSETRWTVEHSSEIWLIEAHESGDTEVCLNQPGSYGINGFSSSDQINSSLRNVLESQNNEISFSTMKIEEGIEYTRSIINQAIEYFTSDYEHIPTPRIKLGVGKYGEPFEIID